MFELYKDIYEKRGANYHAAMQRWPDARRMEFETLMEYTVVDGENPVVVDVPSGGGYIERFLPTGASLIAVDPAASFLSAGSHPGAREVFCAPHDRIPMADGSADLVISMAGLHHLSDQASAFREWARLLRPGGVLAIADAFKSSPTARFLDEVVDAYNSMGHRGNYFDETILEPLEAAGFEVERRERRSYDWTFDCRSEMLRFCRLLFTMDREPDDAELLRESASRCLMGWELYFIRAVKRAGN